MSSDGTKLIAGSNSNTGLWYSVDKGQTWTRSSWTDPWTYAVTTTSGNFNAVSMSSDGTKAVAGSGSEKGVWYSTNGSQLWTKSWPNQGYSGAPSPLTETSFSSIAISSDGTRVVAGAVVVLGGGVAKLWYSTNGGQNFLDTATNTSILSISMSSNGLIVLMGCSSGLRYSKDGGQTLITPSLSSNGDFKNVILSKDGKNAVALSFDTDDGLWCSVNGCESWTKLSTYDTKSILTTLSGTYFNSLFNSMSCNRDCSRIILGSNTNPNNGYIMNRGLIYFDITQEIKKLIKTDNYALSFFNKTPTAQVTTSISDDIIIENNSNTENQIILNDNTRIGGYNIKQIVNALKKYGLLA